MAVTVHDKEGEGVTGYIYSTRRGLDGHFGH